MVAPLRAPTQLVDQLTTMTLAALDDLVHTTTLARDQLTHDPLAALDAWDAVELRVLAQAPVTTATGPGECSVSGTYYDATATSGPVIAVARSLSTGRDAFTALHELAHHIQRTTDDIADELGELLVGDSGRELSFVVEDAVCDRFAASILIPPDQAQAAFASTTPTAGDVVALAKTTVASRSAVCVRAAQHLQVPGAVVLLDPEDNVMFASTRGLFPVRRGSWQGGSSLMQRARAAQAGGSTTVRFTDDDFRLRYRNDIEGDPLFAQVADIGNAYLVIVAVTENPPWKRTFTLPQKATGPRDPSRICPHPECGDYFPAWAPTHDMCGEPICTSCERCVCSLRNVAERDCDRCFTTQSVHAFAGNSTTCHDCE